MKPLEFNENFPDEHSCKMDMKNNREKQGICCKKCENKDLNWIESRYQWHCNECSFRTTIHNGTVMPFSNLPVRSWYLCMIIVTTTKKPISAHEIRRQLGMKRYEPVWYMMHKIRFALGEREDRYILKDMIEFDEGHFKKTVAKGTKIKRGLGSQLQQNVEVMAESAQLEDIYTGKKRSQCRYFKLKVLKGQSAEDVNKCLKKSLEEKTIVLSDKSNRYVDISDNVEGHVSVYSSPKSTNTTLRWVHIAISNAKRTLLGVYHCIKWKNLQAYLNEFCYKLNRRYFGQKIFERLTIAIASSKCMIAD